MVDFEAEGLTISLDEPAFNLLEINLSPSDFKKVAGMPPDWQSGDHRFQKIQVVRNDRLVAWWKDLGPSAGFIHDPFHIVAGEQFRNWAGEIVRIECWHTVGELVDMADQRRGMPVHLVEIEPTPLVEAWEQVVEDRPGLIVGRSVYGYGGERIRSTDDQPTG